MRRRRKGMLKTGTTQTKFGQGAKFHVTSKGVVKPSGRPKKPR